MSILGSIPLEPQADSSEAAKLVWVIDVAEGPLEALLEGELDDVASIDEEMKPYLRDAFIELSYVQLPGARNRLENGEISDAELRESALGEDLRQHGLGGKQLDAKVKGIVSYLKRLKDFRRPKWLRRVLSYLNIVLESLALVNPPAGAIAELKSGFEWALQYEDEAQHNDKDD